MAALKGDYIGFTFNNYHSSDLAIIRTSDGSRYTEELLPEIEDKVVPVPGGDGEYYFGSYYRAKNFSFSIAYDKLTEEKIANLQAALGDRKIHPLIFDERPYKVYHVKVSQPPAITYIPFGEVGTRVYKGEGKINFVSSSPFARSRYKYLEDYPLETFPNRPEWLAASKIQAKGNRDIFASNTIPLYNAGQVPTDFILRLPFHTNGTIPAGRIFLRGRPEDALVWETIAKQGSDWGVQINSKLNLIEGITNSGLVTGTVYNRHKTGGNFFKIPLGAFNLDFSSGVSTTTLPTILYDYLYF